MSDGEDDFLGLADGQVLSSDGESESEDVGDSRERSASRNSTPQRGSTPGGAKNTTAVNKAATTQGSHEPDDQGEAPVAPGSPDSLDSAPMDESDSEAEAPPKPAPAKIPETYVDDDNDQDKYPYEGIFASAQEKEEIYAMSMLEREQILADRTAEVERRRQNRLLRQLVSNQESEEKKHKKRKADSAGLDDEESVHKPAQLRSKRPASSAYDELKRARAAKGDRMRIREEERQNGRLGDRRPTSRNSNFSEQDHYDIRHPTASRSKSPDASYSREPATLRDIEHVRVGRSNFAQICFYPGFEETMVGCFSRVSVGPDDNGIPKYKMARIKEITKGKPYAIQYRSTQIVTDQYAVLAHGKAVREWPFLMLSDGRFTEAEFREYRTACHKDDIILPRRNTLIDKVDRIDALIKRIFTPLELQEKVDRQNALKRRFIPINRERVRRELEEARAIGDETRAADLQEKLDGADAPRLAFRTTLKASTKTTNAHDDKLADANSARKSRPSASVAQDVRLAQIREKQQLLALDQAAARERAEKGQAYDPSKRLKTKTTFWHDVGEKDALLKNKNSNSRHDTESRKNGNSSGAKKESGVVAQKREEDEKRRKDAVAQEALEKLRRKQVDEQRMKGLPTVSRVITGDDVIGALELDIDVDI